MTTDPAPQATGAEALAGAWSVDPAASSVAFHTKAMWLFPVKGSFKISAGSGKVADDGSVNGTLTIDAASIDTGNRRRDDHLRSADFFEVETNPSFTFDVSQASLTGPGQGTIEGSLTIKGVSRSLQIPVTFRRSGDGVDVEADVADLDRREWGITWAKMGAGVHNRLVVHAHFVPA